MLLSLVELQLEPANVDDGGHGELVQKRSLQFQERGDMQEAGIGNTCYEILFCLLLRCYSASFESDPVLFNYEVGVEGSKTL